MRNLTDRFNAHVITLTALMLALMVGLALRPGVTTAQSSHEAAVRDVLMQNAAAFELGDLATLNRLWANDESVLVFESGHANTGWTDYRDNHLVPEMREMRNTRYALSDIRPHIAGNTAWATFRYTIAANINNRRIEGSGLGTAVLERRSGRWQIVHWHTSAPRRAPAPSPSPTPRG
jgi:ketosteroid isomerase-like protein